MSTILRNIYVMSLLYRIYIMSIRSSSNQENHQIKYCEELQITVQLKNTVLTSALLLHILTHIWFIVKFFIN